MITMGLGWLGLANTDQGQIHGHTGPTGAPIDHPQPKLFQRMEWKEKNEENFWDSKTQCCFLKRKKEKLYVVHISNPVSLIS